MKCNSWLYPDLPVKHEVEILSGEARMDMKKHSRVFSENDPLSMVRRSMLYACGWTHEEIQRPLVAVVNTYNEMHPGHMHLKTLAERVKAGVRTAGGLPTEFIPCPSATGWQTATKG